jgi:sterol desaturase/sphingolipid hydroxylase (fatty acid hydroxylase superfamily)
MDKYAQLFSQSFWGYWNYVQHEVLHPGWTNYFYWLIAVSVFFFVLEWFFPWVPRQPAQRKDFWLDGFYMFFNFFLFSLIGYNAVSMVFSQAFSDALYWALGWKNLVAIEVSSWPAVAQLLLLFVVRDFVQWNIHRLLHAVPFLWRVHQVHHSVTEMGFAAHLRYHFGETIVYRTLEYIPLAMIGFGLQEFFLVHLFTLTVGHFNHTNIKVPLGPLKYLFNNPQMHIWHHAKELPRSTGVNFGLTLSIWDYLFGTAYEPKEGRAIPLGFDRVEEYPKGFWGQVAAPFRKHIH